jgi:hypothetical protein
VTGAGSWVSDGDRAFADPAAFRGHQLRQVRELARDVLAEAGVEVAVHRNYLKAADGRTWGLDNLLARCAHEPPELWPQIVSEQVVRLIELDGPAELAKLERPDALRRVYPRLLDSAAIPADWRSSYSYVRPVVGDLVEMLVLECGYTVLWMRDCDVERFGLDDLRTAATANLRAVRPPKQRMLALAHNARVHVLEGGGHTASAALALPDVLTRVFGPLDAPHGVLVAIPTKYEMWLHPIQDHYAYAAYFGLFDEAVRAHAEDPGALSPYVYWWRDGELVQIMTERDGLPHVSDAFIKAVCRAAEKDEPAAMALLATLGRRRRR